MNDRRWTQLLFGGPLALAWSLAVGRANAHPTPGSTAFVDFTIDGARMEQDVPIEELERALHRPLAEAGEPAATTVDRHRELLRGYVAAHIRVTSLSHQLPWQVEVTSVEGRASDLGPRAVFGMTLSAPPHEAPASIHLEDDIIGHEVVSHYTNLYVRSDWFAAVGAEGPSLVGTLHAGRNDVTIPRDGTFLRGFCGVVALGAEHIATGTDHLLFLFALLLVAPIAVDGGRWSARRGTRETLLAIGAVVSAFTVGHSITLALGGLGLAALPVALVEAGIAASILVAALHALRPLFPRREALLAGFFGLVHGLAFASSLPQRDLGRAQTAWTLLGFNVGIELAQVALVVLVVPWLLILARTRAYGGFRIVGASLGVVLASAWLLERTVGVRNPTTSFVAVLEAHPMVLLVALAAGAVFARATERGVDAR